MNSMTGFGRASAPLGGQTIFAQVSAVNRKALDLKISLPDAWSELEPTMAEAVRRVVLRGTVHVRIEVEGANGSAEFDEAAASLWLDRLGALAALRGVSFQPTADTLAQAALQFRRKAELASADVARPVVSAALEQALAGFAAMRATEGATLLRDFQARLALLVEHMEAVAQRAPGVISAAREGLLRRLREAGLEVRVDDERVLKELALFADRCDITEEITRFRSHHAQLSRLLAGPGEIGRKAEFILQEMGREVNTTGAKANDYEIARLVIELKNELERVKEQIANVE